MEALPKPGDRLTYKSDKEAEVLGLVRYFEGKEVIFLGRDIDFEENLRIRVFIDETDIGGPQTYQTNLKNFIGY